MKNFKINEEAIGTVIKVGTIVLYGLVTVASNELARDIIDKVRFSGNVKYSDAVSVTMSSGMFSSDKNRVIDALKRDGDSDYYRAVIQIVKSNMFSSDKVKAITNLCKEEA